MTIQQPTYHCYMYHTEDWLKSLALTLGSADKDADNLEKTKLQVARRTKNRSAARIAKGCMRKLEEVMKLASISAVVTDTQLYASGSTHYTKKGEFHSKVPKYKKVRLGPVVYTYNPI